MHITAVTQFITWEGSNDSYTSLFSELIGPHYPPFAYRIWCYHTAHTLIESESIISKQKSQAAVNFDLVYDQCTFPFRSSNLFPTCEAEQQHSYVLTYSNAANWWADLSNPMHVSALAIIHHFAPQNSGSWGISYAPSIQVFAVQHES